MNDPLLARYEAIAYRHGPIPDSHPARTGAIGRLLGIAAAAPDRCRVLELGCAEGMNLLPLAERFPRSEFVGVDFSSNQIAVGEEARTACDLSNVRLVCADLRAFEPHREPFDYVIAHGVYSWVPDDVKERLLAVCARALSPTGIAYVNYNTLPGWGLLAGLREFLLTEAAREQEPAAQLEHCLRVLRVLAQCLEGQPGAYAALLREAIGDMLRKPPALLYHDELASVNDPCTFSELIRHAARHGLHYVAEAHYASTPYEHVPAPMRATLADLNLDFLRGQQFMDVIFQRWVRSSVLCRVELPPARTFDLRVIRDCAVGLRARLTDTMVNLQPGVTMSLAGPNNLALSFDQPVEKALLAAIAQAAPARVPFAAALGGANRLLGQVRLPTCGEQQLCEVAARLFGLDVLDLVLTGDGDWLRTRNPPAPSALMRHQARHGLPLTNRWHELVQVTAEGQSALTDAFLPGNETALQQAGLLV